MVVEDHSENNLGNDDDDDDDDDDGGGGDGDDDNSGSSDTRTFRTFRGFAAASGRHGIAHEGTARIVLEARDLEKCQPGDILVTIYGSSIINAVLPFIGAIVTDGGGVLSHAAICCREAGLNCVVGTRVATSMIKDGDRVVVNGKKGVVKVVSGTRK
jgi:phosphoenolpyruvate synthase/pyruvate phosphate dikinase